MERDGDKAIALRRTDIGSQQYSAVGSLDVSIMALT
jgi:hypothetical protein